METAIRRRFAVLAALLLALVLAGLVSLPFLQQCCPDTPLSVGWPDPPNRTLLDRLLFMDMVPRLAALAMAAGMTSLVALAGIYVLTATVESRDFEGRSPGYAGFLRAVAAALVVGVLYLYGLFVTGYFQLGWFNLVWIVGIPVLLAALTGRDQFERRWGGLFLIIPGFAAEMAIMIALDIDPN
jgi:hypothetical protein